MLAHSWAAQELKINESLSSATSSKLTAEPNGLSVRYIYHATLNLQRRTRYVIKSQHTVGPMGLLTANAAKTFPVTKKGKSQAVDW